MSSEVAVLLKSIAKEINKDEKIVQPFINILEENFYDTIESIKELKLEDYEKWKFPKRISDLILQKTGDIVSGKTQVGSAQQGSDNQKQVEQVQQAPQQAQTQMVSEPTVQDLVAEKLKELRNSISTAQRFIELVTFVRKILQNITNSPAEQKFRKIKQSNQHFQTNFLPNKTALEFMYLNNFQIDDEGIFLSDENVNLDILQISISHIDNAVAEATPSSFNPYQTYTAGNEVLCSRNLAQREGFVNYYEKLQELKAKRFALMSQPISDRKTRIYKQAQNQNPRQMEIEEEDAESNVMMKEYTNEIKKLIQNLDKQSFSSKSKQEYEKLLKDPVYSKCSIKIKFPQNVILEGVFSPMETIKHVIDFTQLNLENPELPFYLFNTPPRQVFDKKFHAKTLDEMGCLPGAIFYFALDNDPNFQKSFYLKQEMQLN